MKIYIVWFAGRKAEKVSLVPKHIQHLPFPEIKKITKATAVVTATSYGEAIEKASQTL